MKSELLRDLARQKETTEDPTVIRALLDAADALDQQNERYNNLDMTLYHVRGMMTALVAQAKDLGLLTSVTPAGDSEMLKSAPCNWTVGSLAKHCNHGPKIRLPDGQLVAARPFGYFSLWNRLTLAWAVFTGKADALTWPGTKPPKAY